MIIQRRHVTKDVAQESLWGMPYLSPYSASPHVGGRRQTSFEPRGARGWSRTVIGYCSCLERQL